MTLLEKLRAERAPQEREEIVDALTRARGNVAEAARLVEAAWRRRLCDPTVTLSRAALYRKMWKHGLAEPARQRA